MKGLEKARKEKGLTQADLASKLGVNVSTINRWEKGSKYPDILTLIELTKLLSASTDYIIFGK